MHLLPHSASRHQQWKHCLTSMSERLAERLRTCLSKIFFPFIKCIKKLWKTRVLKQKLPFWRGGACEISKCLPVSYLSGDNLPEEHCKYTKHFFFPSPPGCFSHISHPLLTHHTYNSVQRICFFTTCTERFLTPYAFFSWCSKDFLSLQSAFVW